MTDERIIEEMAKLDHFEIPKGLMYDLTDLRGATGRRIGKLESIPDYLNDHNAVQRVIDGLSTKELLRYAVIIVNGHGLNDEYWAQEHVNPYSHSKIVNLLRATPRQKCKDILKAKKLWERSWAHT